MLGLLGYVVCTHLWGPGSQGWMYEYEMMAGGGGGGGGGGEP